MQPKSRRASRLIILLIAVPFFLITTSMASAISVTEIQTLTKLGISPTEIIKSIEKHRSVFRLSIQDILSLKKANVHQMVINYMLATPKKFGKGKMVTKTKAPIKVLTLTPEELRARDERMREEARRLLADKNRAEQVQRKAYAKGVLRRGRLLADQGKFVQSIQAYQAFVKQGGFSPDSEESYLAKFGIADALVKAKLYQSAAKELVEILLAGPKRPFFQTAFTALRQLRKKVNYSPPDLEELTKFFVGKFSKSFQDSYNYVLGEFYYDYNNWTKALKYLDVVSPSSRDYGKAQYLKGLVEVRNRLYKSAVGSFQRAIVATEENRSDPEVGDLAYLALARIAYEAGDYDAAIYYYRKVPRRSYKRATSLYESAWVYFVKGDTSRALGTFHTLHSPYFNHQFYPELWILEATVYMNLCRFRYAEDALKEYTKEIWPLAIPLKQFLLKTVRPEEYYTALVYTLAGKKTYGLPKRLTAVVLANVDFYNLYQTVKQIESEQRLMKKNASQLGEFGAQITRKLADLHAARVRETGIKIQRILKSTEGTLANYSIKFKEIEVDIQDEKLAEEERKLAALSGGPVKKKVVQAEKGGTTAIVGSDSWEWPFEGSYWSDEIGYYRAFIRDKCATRAR
jgi:tetratricopeptide (TPR) repeat protein